MTKKRKDDGTRKIRICTDSRANIHSKNIADETIMSAFGMTDAEWDALSEEKQDELLKDYVWCADMLDYWIEDDK